MIVVSASMPKSGSAWLYNMTQDLLLVAGNRRAQQLREERGLGPWLRGPNCSVVNLRDSTLRKLAEAVGDTQTIAVKTHRAPTAALRRRLAAGEVRATYVYRDPRDVVVSLLDHGRRLRSEGRAKRIWGIGPYRSYAKLRTVRQALLYMRLKVIPIWRAWVGTPGVLLVRYEDLKGRTDAELRRVAEYLGVDLAQEQISRIVEAYRPERLATAGRRYHLNRGTSGRFRTELSPPELVLCTKRLGSSLAAMGYAP